MAVSGSLPKARSRPTPTVESHPLRCFKRSTSEIPAASVPRHRRGRSEIIVDSTKDISEVDDGGGVVVDDDGFWIGSKDL